MVQVGVAYYNDTIRWAEGENGLFGLPTQIGKTILCFLGSLEAALLHLASNAPDGAVIPGYFQRGLLMGRVIGIVALLAAILTIVKVLDTVGKYIKERRYHEQMLQRVRSRSLWGI